MKFARIILLAVGTFLLAACDLSGDPVPEDKAAYIGEWEAVGFDLVITADGGVAYERTSGGGSSSVNGPIQEFDGDDFSVGVWFISTTFEVSTPPYLEDGVWKMVVDGVELTRVK
jgi:hypothetical protein